MRVLAKISFLVSLCIFMAACKDDDNGPTVDMITVDVGQNNLIGIQTFAFITGPDGTLLDLQEVTFGTPVLLISPVDLAEVDVTTVFIASTSSALETHTGIKKGSTLLMHVPQFIIPAPATGTARFTVKNFLHTSAYHNFDLSFGNGADQGEATNLGDAEYSGNDLNVACTMRRTTSNFFIGSTQDEKRVYALVKDVKVGDKVTLDFNADFKPCETVIDLGTGNFVPGLVYGTFASSNETYKISESQLNSSTLRNSISYASGFDSYTTTLSKSPDITPGDSRNWSFYKKGSPITPAFAFPDYSIEMRGSGLTTFEGTASVPYNRVRAHFGFVTPGAWHTWKIVGKTINDVNRKAISDHLRKSLPKVPFDSFAPGRIEIEVSKQGRTYSAYLEHFLSNNQPAEYEEMWCSKILL